MNHDLFFLYDEKEATKTRFVSFAKNHRHDLIIVPTDRFYGKKIVINLQTNRSAIIGDDDLDEEGYLEHAFNVSSEEAEELRQFLKTIEAGVTPPSD